MKTLLITVLLCGSFFSLSAGNKDSGYIETLTKRSDKIVKTLDIKDSSQYNSVRDILVNQYQTLGKIHDGTNDLINKVKSQNITEPEKEAEIEVLELKRNKDLYFAQSEYIGSLSAYLTNDQVEAVKDGMTYGVVDLTYNSYLDMIPSLKENEKVQIYSWLVEAREHAISAESSRAKHGWFNKYKGKINNYLSANGYDIQKERKEWQKRQANK